MKLTSFLKLSKDLDLRVAFWSLSCVWRWQEHDRECISNSLGLLTPLLCILRGEASSDRFDDKATDTSLVGETAFRTDGILYLKTEVKSIKINQCRLLSIKTAQGLNDIQF